MSETNSMNNEAQWKSVYFLGGIAAIIALIGIVIDVFFGSVSGGNLSALPQTAVERFAQFQINPLLGLYNLDLLNIINQIIFIPVYFALFAAHRKTNIAFAQLALIIFLVGTAIFVTTNTALPMLDLSRKYAAAASESQKTLLAAAGEAMLAQGRPWQPGSVYRFPVAEHRRSCHVLCHVNGQGFQQAQCVFGNCRKHLIAGLYCFGDFCAQHKRYGDRSFHAGRIIIHGLDDHVYDQALSNFQKRQLTMSGLGHLAPALFAKSAAPKVPLLALVIAAETNEILYFLFSSVGIEAKRGHYSHGF